MHKRSFSRISDRLRELRRYAVVLAAALMAGVVPSVAEPQGAMLTWGVNGHPLVSYPGVKPEQQIDLIQQLGMTSYRVDISSLRSAPALRHLVQLGKEKGIAILPVLTPALKLDKETEESLYADAYQLAFQLVSQLKDDVRVWELGNEMENYAIIRACEMREDGTQYNCNWGPAGGVSPLDYYPPRWRKVSAVLKGLSDGAVAADPTVRKAMGTAGWGHIGAFDLMERDGIRWDISVWHMYGQDPEWAFKVLAQYKRPIWVTEINHPLGSMNGVDKQAHGLVRTMTRLRQLQAAYRVEAGHIYELLDETYWAPNYEAYMGLVELNRTDNGRWRLGATKPAFDSLREFIAGSAPYPEALTNCFRDERNSLKFADAMQAIYAHCLILGRTATEQEIEEFKTSRAEGVRPLDGYEALVRSAAFRQRHARMNDGDFVEFVYHQLLLRASDGAGRAGYLDNLEKRKVSRDHVALALVRSDEFRARHSLLFH